MMMLRTTYAKRPQGDYCDHHRGKPSPIRWAGLAGLVLVPDALKAPWVLKFGLVEVFHADVSKSDPGFLFITFGRNR